MKNIPLSPVDYIFTGIGSQPITFAFLYNETLDKIKLQESLTKTLEYFPLFKSKLVKISKQNYEFQHSEDGLAFNICESNLTFKESRNIEHYVSPVNTVTGDPLTRITLTQTLERSVLAVSVSHAVADGFSYFHFFSSWARLCRGDRIMEPGMERSTLFPVAEDSAAEITPDIIYQNCGLFYRDRRPGLQKNSGREERLFLEKQTIQSQMQEIKKEYPHILFSDNDIIAASLWKKYIPLWSQNENNPQTFLTCPVDFRRIFKTVPKTFFGCAVCVATACIDFERLQQASVGELAVLVNRSVRSVNDLYVGRSLQTLENLRHQKGLDACERIHLRHPSHGMIITNLTRMPIRDLDFGNGVPADFLIYSEVLRSAAILPAENGYEIVVLHPTS